MSARVYAATRENIKDRKAPPTSFLEELIDWGIKAAKSQAFIFTANPRVDAYSVIKPVLAPDGWPSFTHRVAGMLELMRVVAAFESSYDWNCGYDKSNPRENSVMTKSAGIFQISADSLAFDSSLALCLRNANKEKAIDAVTFRRTMMEDHIFVFEYTARLWRFTKNHNGPIRDGHAAKELNLDAYKEILGFLS